MKLDLRFRGDLNLEVVNIFNHIADSKRKAFTLLVDRLSSSSEGNLDWWVEGPASRNTLSSPFFSLLLLPLSTR